MDTFDLEQRLQKRLALLAIGRSTLRSQGAPGMVGRARIFLSKLDLRRFSTGTEELFQKQLNYQTSRLASKFPAGGKGNWGAARKSINIFMRDAVYCAPIRSMYSLSKIEKWLEVPLDRHVYDGLKKDLLRLKAAPRLLPWPGIKHLKPKTSRAIQQVAAHVSKQLKVSRVHLDIRYWRSDQIDELGG